MWVLIMLTVTNKHNYTHMLLTEKKTLLNQKKKLTD